MNIAITSRTTMTTQLSAHDRVACPDHLKSLANRRSCLAIWRDDARFSERYHRVEKLSGLLL